MTFFRDEAHNDYAQLPAEMGLLGFSTLVSYMIILYRQVRRKLGKWTTDVSSAVTFACALGVIGILVHSLVDFNLQIPANAAFFYVLTTICCPPHPFCSARGNPALSPQKSRISSLPQWSSSALAIWEGYERGSTLTEEPYHSLL